MNAYNKAQQKMYFKKNMILKKHENRKSSLYKIGDETIIEKGR